eukprot:4272303-Pleurochrysis_carterae.AAC.2
MGVYPKSIALILALVASLDYASALRISVPATRTNVPYMTATVIARGKPVPAGPDPYKLVANDLDHIKTSIKKVRRVLSDNRGGSGALSSNEVRLLGQCVERLGKVAPIERCLLSSPQRILLVVRRARYGPARMCAHSLHLAERHQHSSHPRSLERSISSNRADRTRRILTARLIPHSLHSILC